jgi:hypothetical protein
LHPEETEPLTAKAKLHRQRDRIRAALAFDILASDSGVEAERLWRRAPTSGRAMARAHDSLDKLGRGGPSSVAKAGIEAIKQSTAPNEAIYPQIATNEPKLSGHSVRSARRQNEASSRTDRKSQVAFGK